MTKDKPRKSILVSESCFDNFNEVRNSLDMNSSDTLNALMQSEILKTETIIVQRAKVQNRIEDSTQSNTRCNSFNELCSREEKKRNEVT